MVLQSQGFLRLMAQRLSPGGGTDAGSPRHVMSFLVSSFLEQITQVDASDCSSRSWLPHHKTFSNVFNYFESR